MSEANLGGLLLGCLGITSYDYLSSNQLLLNLISGHPMLCREQLRLSGDLFIELVHILCERKLMSNNDFVEVAEQVRIYLYILSRGASYRKIVERFQHSLSTIIKYLLEALDALVTLSVDVTRPYDSLDEVPLEISSNGCYHPFF